MARQYVIQVALFSLLAAITPPPAAEAADVLLPKTGQVVTSSGGDDGDLQRGAAWPSPRFTTNGSGTVTDNLTGLIWLQNATCTDTVGGVSKGGGALSWTDAVTWSNNLASGSCSLSDGSTAGDWRLPNRLELLSLLDSSMYNPPLPVGHPFTGVQNGYYWTSSFDAAGLTSAWQVGMASGTLATSGKAGTYSVWPVRGGHFGNAVSAVSPAAKDFGTVTIGSSSGDTVTIGNTAAGGSSRLQINAIALAGTDAGQFTVNPGDGSGGTCGSLTPIIPPGGSCTVSVSFTPATLGQKSATLSISGSDTAAPEHSVLLSGDSGFHATGSVSGGNGSITSANPAYAASGFSASFLLAPAQHYEPALTVGGSCPAGSFSGTTYTTGPIIADCTVDFSFVKSSYLLTLTPYGTGGGTVQISSGGTCSGTCSQSVEGGTVVTLTPTPVAGSLFSGWNGCPSISGDTCTLTMSGPLVLSPYFNLASNGVAAVGLMTYYGTVTAAYGTISDSPEIRLREGDIHEVLTLNRPVSVTMKGGYFSSFITVVGTTVLHGGVTITDGTVTFENVSVGG